MLSISAQVNARSGFDGHLGTVALAVNAALRWYCYLNTRAMRT